MNRFLHSQQLAFVVAAPRVETLLVASDDDVEEAAAQDTRDLQVGGFVVVNGLSCL